MLSSGSETALEPPAAEAARSVLLTATTLALHLSDVPGLVTVGGHAGDACGRLLVPTSADCRVLAAVRRARPTARAVLTDVAPLPLRSRWRGRLELTGRLDEVSEDDAACAWEQATGGQRLVPGRRLMRLTPFAACLIRGREEPREVCPREYGEARPDPVAAVEAEVLWHLQSGHPDQVLRLADLLPRRMRADGRVVPLRLERRAVVLRVERAHDDHDVPLALACGAARHPGEVLAALRALLDTCAGRAG